MINDLKRVLVLAPHTDDGELGCGGTIAKFREKNIEVYYVAFSTCEDSVLDSFSKDILKDEVKEATLRIGIKTDCLIIKNYKVRTFGFNRQDILQDMIDLRNQLKPDLVFMPSLNDIHQDHHTIAQEGLRAFKHSSILCYEMPWNNLSFNSSCYIKLSSKHLKSKIYAMEAYESQMHRPYAKEESIKALARLRGLQVNHEYAESFEVLRILS